MALTGFALIAPLAMLGGCEILAGIKEKTLADGGSGGGGTISGAHSGANGSGGVGGMIGQVDGGGPGGGGPGGRLPGDPVCEPGALPDPTCAAMPCDGMGNTGSDKCNCGACGHSCGGSTCSAGACAPMTMLSGLPFIYSFATNGTSVFFASNNDTDHKSTLYGLHLDARDLSPMSALPYMFGPTIQGEIGAIAADCSRAYLATQFLDKMGKAQVYALSLDGKTLEMIASVDAPIYRIVADGARAYWTGSNSSKGFVEMWDPAMMKRTTLPQPSTYGLAVDKTYLYWSVADKDPEMSGIRRARISQFASEPAIEVVTRGGHPTAIAVDDVFVYWIELNAPSPSYIRRAKKDGSGGAESVSGVTSSVESDLAVDEANVYWVEDNIVRKRSKDGNGAPVTLADRTPANKTFQSYGLTIDRSRVYFADTSPESSTVMWVAK